MELLHDGFYSHTHIRRGGEALTQPTASSSTAAAVRESRTSWLLMRFHLTDDTLKRNRRSAFRAQIKMLLKLHFNMPLAPIVVVSLWLTELSAAAAAFRRVTLHNLGEASKPPTANILKCQVSLRQLDLTSLSKPHWHMICRRRLCLCAFMIRRKGC